MKQIFILGAYGQNNLGDDALLQVFLSHFSDAQLVVNSARPADTAERFGVKTVATYQGIPRFSRLRALLGSQLIIFGGGSLLKEVEGNHIARVLYFVRIFFLLIFGKILSRPTAMLGSGIGPLYHPLYKTLAKLAANLTDVICVRDQESRLLLESIGVTKPVYVTADAVFTLANQVRNTSNIEGVPDSPYVVVIPRYSLTEKQQASIAEACDLMVEAHGVKVLFMPFQIGYLPKYDDMPATDAILARMRHANQASVIVVTDPQAGLAVICKAEMVVSIRLHGLIFAAIQNVASVAISYEVKVSSFMAELQQSGPPYLSPNWKKGACRNCWRQPGSVVLIRHGA